MRKVHFILAIGAFVLPLATVQPSQAADADNTARNARDADGTTLTPLDQGENAADRTITQQIRKAVGDHDQLSTNAKNVKIITRNGVVTLRGPVKNTKEKTIIASVAQNTGGVKRVDNQLEIERN
jgi:hyperosmotically inducible periplasmic protein